MGILENWLHPETVNVISSNPVWQLQAIKGLHMVEKFILFIWQKDEQVSIIDLVFVRVGADQNFS